MKTAYPQTQNPVSIRLYANIPFDNTYEHHSLISELFEYDNSRLYEKTGVLACESFIDRKRQTTGSPYYYPRWDMTDTFNFDFQNGLIGSITLELTPEQTNANYMRVTCGSDIYYYFITGIKQVNFETYTLSLELDVLMTYQDEFLEGVKDIPFFTERKHCHRYNDSGISVHCADFKTGDDTFAGVKPSIITDLKQLDYGQLNMKKITNIKWLYICCDNLELISGDTRLPYGDALYTANDVTHPLTILAVPLNITQLILKDRDGNVTYSFSTAGIKNIIKSLVGNGVVHGTKLSNYPPFSNARLDLSDSGVLTIYADGSITAFSSSTDLYTFTIGNNSFVFHNPSGTTNDTNLKELMKNGAILINKQNDLSYTSDNIVVNSAFNNSQKPSITMNRYKDPKLLFAPFTKYVICAKYSSDGCEFYPELLFSEYYDTNYTQNFEMYATAYIGDNNYYTRPNRKRYTVNGNYEYAYNYYQYAKVGLAGSVNYTIPAGENALDVFNATQAQAFYQSKTASGITSGLTILGGVGSIGMGIGLLATGGGSVAGMGMIAGGATAFAGGIASMSNTIKSSNAKIEDLKNTPDSINISGSNFILDDAITNGSDLPYLIRYECGSVIQENANDYFYNYGYQVARDCYFNVELNYTDAPHKVDNNIFGRTIFNYVKLNEDITNKINANIPQVIKQKLSQVFNKGITLWSFFGCDGLWNNNNFTSTTDPDNWFMKHNLDNTEYQG